MKLSAMVFLLIAHAVAVSPDISHFASVRTVTINTPDRQNFIAIDQDIWNKTRPNLGDMRLYSGNSEIPYVLREEKGGKTTEAVTAKMMNLRTAGKHTEFDLDMGSLAQYNRVGLQIEARNFVATAQIEGRNDLSESIPTELGQTTLYDFSQENLGSNFLIRLAPSNFHYLHVRLPADIHPEQIKGATAYNIGQNEAAWVRVGWSPGVVLQGRNTVQHWNFSPRVPVDRIHFTVSPDEQNFRRTVTIAEENGLQLTADEISRVTMQHGGSPLTVEHLDVDMLGAHSRVLTVTIENKNDGPLKDLKIQPLSIERRIYFEPNGAKTVKLYYGDGQLSAPAYAYGSAFRESTTAARASLSAPQQNASFAQRPDDRPWQVRYKLALWAALIIAVLVIGGTALTSMRTSLK